MDINWILPSRATQSPLKVANSARLGSIVQTATIGFHIWFCDRISVCLAIKGGTAGTRWERF